MSCVAVGDVLNQNRNCLVILTGDGWCYIYASDNEPFTSRSPLGKDINTIEGVEDVIIEFHLLITDLLYIELLSIIINVICNIS